MLRILGNPKRACDGLTRRDLLVAGGLEALGLGLGASLGLKPSLGRAAGPDALASQLQLPQGKAKSVIFLFLFGGPSQLETFDLKPHAPVEARGPFKPIGTSVPGVQICEHLPLMAKRMHRVALLRGVNCQDANHNTSLALSGHDARIGGTAVKGINTGIPFDWPFFMSAVEHVRQREGQIRPGELPQNICLPNQLGLLEGYHRTGPYGGFLGSRYDPVCTRVGNPSEHLYEPGGVKPETLRFTPSGAMLRPEITLDKLHQRRDLVEQMFSSRRDLEQQAAVGQYGRAQDQAYRLLMSSKMHRALDLNAEPKRVRDRYGWNLFGQSVLLARRLVEAGVPLITAIWDATEPGPDISLLSWDTHWDHFKACQGWLLPGLDQALSALMDELDERGLLDETLIVCFGEMGRTPKINDRAGRDHWVGSYNALFAGAGVQGGAVHGSSDKIAAFVNSGPVSPRDLLATTYHCLGIGPETMIHDRQGRPLTLYGDGRPIRAILA